MAVLIYELMSIFGGNGHPYIPPETRFELTHQGGSQVTMGFYTGFWVPSQMPSAGVQLIGLPSGVGGKRYGLPSDFWSWYHRQVKRPGDPDLTGGQAEYWFEIWLQEGRPDAEGHRTISPGEKLSPVFPMLEGEMPPVQPLGDPIPLFGF